MSRLIKRGEKRAHDTKGVVRFYETGILRDKFLGENRFASRSILTSFIKKNKVADYCIVSFTE